MKKKSKRLLHEILGLLLRAGWTVLTVIAVFVLMIGVHINKGSGMSPSFKNKDIVIFYRLSKGFESGDVVVYLDSSGNKILGRVVAVSGDTVDITGEGLKINGYFKEERYTSGEILLSETGTEFPLTVPNESYFILSDDRSEAADSRLFGTISASDIKGRAILTIRSRDF
ncbi:MAG: signal peptidase I [Ruminococcus sp.]|nr:signal peptidase I [Ruminococcus sp.]